ncbi:transglutaminase family protein [Dechloromonas sp. HYN0024]|uniref:transglutaminase-like domain-containing protein n=1 Tax=Dechloromonas sp. HYN0024 TaxID=2231055 RepID=UPI000E430417|nr:transglutaminase-like domain-containing protein [Dechloromonas sp. HYN0024]AXS80048.1 transglutaminase domain-containing protein [Dechloromonas sp. HYN0024]
MIQSHCACREGIIMCFKQSKIIGLNDWNWDGDHIMFNTVLKSGRPTVAKPYKQYPMDVREYVATENNALIRQTLSKDVTAYMRREHMNKALFSQRRKGAFDYRVHVLTNFVSERIQYQTRRGRDPWQYPEETLALRTGDCEDIAFVLASLLLASGVSAYNLRVALGNVLTRHSNGQEISYDHMWVMYKAESGQWHLLEPLRQTPSTAETGSGQPALPLNDALVSMEYRPRFVFNGDHVWIMRNLDQDGDLEQLVRKNWHRINPKFAGAVHQNIVNQALAGIAPAAMVNSLNRHFSFGWTNGLVPIIEDIDNFVTHGYNSLDHFDNGFIAEGWAVVTERLTNFGKNNTDFDSFALAAHGISDFYAHSSYGHFAKIVGNAFETYDPQNPASLGMAPPNYAAGSSFDLSASGVFKPNRTIFKGDRDSIPDLWAGQLISGRYAQPGDSQSILEGPTKIPDSLLKRTDFAQRGSLPHHNTMAVDQATREKTHLLYTAGSQGPTDRMAYANQFAWRVQTATNHIRAAYLQQAAPNNHN